GPTGRRLGAEMAEKLRIYGGRYPLDEDFLAALAYMPPACGAALGFDRLVMLATGAGRIEQVIWTPVVAGGGPPPRELRVCLPRNARGVGPVRDTSARPALLLTR